MKKHVVMAVVGVALSASSVLAQGLTTPVCPGGAPLSQAQIAQDACQQAFDIYQFMAPQLGISLAGGNAVLGTGSVLGGLGHLSVGVRGNVIKGQLPDVQNYSQSVTGAPAPRNLASKDQYLGLPTADAAVGIFKGFPVGLTNFGGLDVLASAEYLPNVTQNGLSITPQQNWQLGYGARVGLLSESIVVPGISVTYLKRDLPKTDIIGTTGIAGGTDTLSIKNLVVKTTAWRIVASKSFIVFGLAGGFGQDKYDQSADIQANVSQGIIHGQTSVPGTTQSLTRTNIFGDVSLNLPLFKLVAEIGQVSGGTVNTYNTFSGGRADRSMLYGSAGLRLSW